MWCEDHATVRLWITLLAMADRNGYVGASLPGLAARARITVPEAEAGMAKFMAPDPYSRSPDHEGRRVELADRGWRLLNHARFRAARDEDARREWDRNRKRKAKLGAMAVADSTRNSTPDQENPPRSAHAETEYIQGGRRAGGAVALSPETQGSESVAAHAQRAPRARRAAQGPQLALRGAEDPEGGLAPAGPEKRRTGRVRANGDHPAVLAAYLAAYEASHGVRPTIGAKQAAQVATLLRSHSGAEVLRRLDLLASGRGPAWLYRDGGSWDLGQLVAHFDKLAVEATPPSSAPARGVVGRFLAAGRAAEAGGE